MSDNTLCLTILESSKVAKYRDVIYLMHIVLLQNITKPLHQNIKKNQFMNQNLQDQIFWLC